MKKFESTVVVILVLSFVTFSHLEIKIVEAESDPMWQRTYGGTEVDASTSLVPTTDGGYALVGFTRSFGVVRDNVWLVKTDEFGNMEWNKTYGDTESEKDATSLIQTLDGGYAFAGVTAEGTDPWSIRYDAWLVKTDEFGNMEWNKTYGGTGSDSASSLVQTAEGEFVLAGSTTSFGAGDRDLWLISTDLSGNMKWNQTYGGSDEETTPYGLVQTSDGGFALAGRTYPLGGYFCDCWLVKTDSYGKMEWNRTYGGARMDYSSSLVQTSDGGFALAGCTDSVGAGGYDFWLIKTDNYGNIEWNQTYGTEYQDTNPSLINTLDGGFALAGYTHPDLADLMLVKTDSLGNILWNQTYQGQAGTGLPSLVQTLDGGFALAGAKGFRSANTDDFWLIKTDANGIPEFPSWTPLLIMSVAVMIVAVIYRCNLDKQNHRGKTK